MHEKKTPKGSLFYCIILLRRFLSKRPKYRIRCFLSYSRQRFFAHKPGYAFTAVFLAAAFAPKQSRRLPYGSFLFRAENSVAGVTESGYDVAVFIQAVVKCGAVNINIGMFLGKGFKSLGSGDGTHELDVLGTSFFDK